MTVIRSVEELDADGEGDGEADAQPVGKGLSGVGRIAAQRAGKAKDLMHRRHLSRRGGASRG